MTFPFPGPLFLEEAIEESIVTEQEQRDYIKELARRVAEIANDPEMEKKRQRWRDTYMLRKPDRSPVWLGLDHLCRLDFTPEESLKCENPFLRRLEWQLRSTLQQHDFGDDTIILPYWKVPAAIGFEEEHLWGVPVKFHRPEAKDGAWSYDPPIKNEADMNRLRMPTWKHNEAETDRRLNRFGELLDGIFPIRMSAAPPIFPGVGRNASDLIGLDGLLLNMAAEPDMIHRVMTFIRDSVLKCLDEVEAMGILTENNDEPIHFSESLKTTPPAVPVRLSDLWFRTESQQFEHVSPDMWREFCLNYQKPIMQRFRSVSYGCCENLTDRMDDVLSIPNLRIFVNGPWTDLATTAEKCQDKYSIVWRQKASDVIFSSSMAPIKEHLEEGMRMTQGCYRAIVLQEVVTTNGNPQRLYDWVAAAKDISERIS